MDVRIPEAVRAGASRPVPAAPIRQAQPRTPTMAHTETERNLLFGLLALQVGLVDQDRLLAAFRAWGRDRARPLEELLGRGGRPRRRSARLVNGLVAQHLKKHGGSVEKSLAALDVGPSTREGLARLGDPEVEATLAQLAPASDPRRWRAHGDVLRRLGHFRRPEVPDPAASCAGRPGRRVRGAGCRAAPRGGAQANPGEARR